MAAQVEHQHHPPQSADEYIKVLEDPSRDEWQKPDLVVESLGLRPGDEVADVGAGSGYFTIRLAREVGPTGKVYAVDIDPQLLASLERRAKEEQLENIQTILADRNDPELGSNSVDMIFICDVLHHISGRDKYYPLLARALRPSGRLVNIDFHKRKLPVGPPEEMKIDRKAMIKEVEPAGFQLVKEFEFLKYQYFLIFER
jgi:ubiquinone/menaquinone biosynthesis C-methylase UbiE